MSKPECFKFKVHTGNLIKEIMNNHGSDTLHKPLLVFRDCLRQVAERSSILNDVELNKLMMQLALYEVADPESKEYNPEFVCDYLEGKFE